jgi:hypothetical protein
VENYSNECELGYGSSISSRCSVISTGISCCFSEDGRAEGGITLTKLDGEPVNVEEPVVNETVVEDEAAEIGGGEPNHYV